MRFIIRWLTTAIAVGLAVQIVPGVDVLGGNEAWISIFVFGLFLSLVNMIIKPVIQILSLPFTILTLGMFYLVVNTLMLYIANWFAVSIFELGIDIKTFGGALIASIVISIVSALMNTLVSKDS